MRWSETGAAPCSIARSLSVVGDCWTLLLLREAFRGTSRFEEFRERLGVARNVLAARLRRLAEHGVLERVAETGGPGRRGHYRLTAKGRDLYPVLLALLRWGDRWLADERGAPMALVHQACRHQTTPTVTCSHCGKPLEPGQLRARLSAAALSGTTQR